MFKEIAISTFTHLTDPFASRAADPNLNIRWKVVSPQRSSLTIAFVASAALLLLSACGGGGGGTAPIGDSGEAPASAPIATVSAYSPVNEAIGVAIGTPISIKLSVANATSSDAGKVTWICGGKTIPFVTTSSLSSDGATLTITMTPAANASVASDVCAYHGTVTTNGPGGHVDTTVSGGYTNLAAAGSGTNPLPSTLSISAYLGSAYSKDRISLATDVLAAENLAGQGYSCSSAELSTLTNLKESHVQSFLNEALANIWLVKSTNVIDKAAIDNLLYAYQTQDLAWVSTSHAGSCGFSAVDLAATGFESKINAYYSNLIVQVNAL